MSATANHIYLYGDYSLDEKISLIMSKISSSSGRDAWVQLFRMNPSFLSPYEIAVLFRNITTSTPISFMFEVVGGSYNILLRCFASSPVPATGKSQLDSNAVNTWSTAPGYTVYQQNIPIYTDVSLSAGLHQVVISSISPIALVDMTIQNVNGSENIVVQAINTFLYPNKVQSFPRTLQPDYIIPAINTRLFGPTLGPVAPFTGTFSPETCIEPVDTPLFSSNSILLLSGTQTMDQKLDVANQIRTYCGRNQWVKFLTLFPNIISTNETIIILNSTDKKLTFRFAVPPSIYNIMIRCVMPSANTDSAFVQLDTFPEQMFQRAFGPGKFSSNQMNILLYEKLQLDDGYHQMTFASREPIGYLALIIHNTNRTFNDIVIPALSAVNNPFQVFGNPDYLATFTPPVFTTMPPTTTLMPTTTMSPTTTLMPTTTMSPTTTLMPTTTSPPQLSVTATGSYNVSNLVNGYRFYTFTGAGTIKVNKPVSADILVVGRGGNSGYGQSRTQSSGDAWGGGGGAGGIAYGTVRFTPDLTYTLNVSSVASISSTDLSITAQAGNTGKDGLTSNYTATGGKGGDSGTVSQSGNVSINQVVGTGSLGSRDTSRGTASAGNGGGIMYTWIDGVAYGGGGQANVAVTRYGQGGANGFVNRMNSGGGPILKIRFYFS